ncbi:hypothetical protein [Nocardia sp. NPDC127526]|uniref:hypothetical protein n=1 Tax=Nocardia sp. NPDC127526 TaxID=3345393 RepID=UPI00363B48B1
MLVKVRNDDPSRLSSTERTVVNWLKSWSGPHAVPGIAIVQCQDADVVVWTPQTCVVVGVHGFTERVTGTLSCAQDQPWTVDGKPAPIDGDADPLERVRRQTVSLAGQLRSAPGREHVPVSGLVLLVPQLGSRVKLDKGALPPGIDVLIGDGPSSLRAYFTKLAEGAEPAWDAAQVSQALGALGFAAAASYSDLISEGFPQPASAAGAPLPMSAAPTVRVPSVPVESLSPPAATEPKPPARSAEAPRPHTPETGGRSTEPDKPSAPRPAPAPRPEPAAAQQVPPASDPESSRPHPAAAAAAGVAAAGAAAAAYRAVSGTSDPHRSDPAPQQSPPAAPQQGPAPQQSPAYPGTPPSFPRPSRPPRRSLVDRLRGRRTEQPIPPNLHQSDPRATHSTNQPAAPGFPVWTDRPHSAQVPTTRRRRDLPIVGGLILLFLILLITAMCASRGSGNEEDRDPRPTTSIRETPTTSADPTIPSTTIAPPCFPLQPGC